MEPALNRRQALALFVAYLVFVVYGSLVPFQLRPATLQQALEQFSHIAYLQLGVASRADWIANLVLYVPLAFLGCASVVGLRMPGRLRLLAVLPVSLMCLGIAVAVEFIQIFFAPRTVSLNDLLAESLGTLVGVVAFIQGRWRLASLLDAFATGGRPSVVALITLYALAYLALSLFPYDFLVSPDELAEKLESSQQGWLLAGDCGSSLRCAARQVGEMAAIAPLGLLIALAARALTLPQVFFSGTLLGLGLELGQLLLASGISQGLSVVWRGLGLTAGFVIGRILRERGTLPIAQIIRRALPYAALPYAVLLAGVSGWLSNPWQSTPDLLERLRELRFMPFYYHYYTTESAAMASLTAQLGLYAPLGLAVWAWCVARAEWRSYGLASATLLGAAVALPLELGKLWLPPRHPDLTNLLIAAAGAGAVLALGNWLQRVLGDDGTLHPTQAVYTIAPAPIAATAIEIQPREAAPIAGAPLHPLGLTLGVMAALGFSIGIALFPVGRLWLLSALGIYGMLLWFRPVWAFFLIPVLLPLLDLSPITGRLALDEFDHFVLLTLALGYPRFFRGRPMPWPSRWLASAYWLLWVSWCVSSARGLWPLLEASWPVPDSSHSPLEAWKVGKGVLWALLFVPLIRRWPYRQAATALPLLVNGVAVGLIGVALIVVWERLVFVGLTDFGNVFRVTGPFASMNTGGAYIEAFLGFAFPLLVARILMMRGVLAAALGFPAAALVSYAMMVTFSRVGYVALLAGLLPVIVALWRRQQTRGGPRRWLLAGIMAATVATALPIISGGFALDRLSRSSSDFSFRLSHWGQALGLMDHDFLSTVAGMGFGQYPLLYLLRADTARPPGTYAVLRDGDNPYLSLGSGESVFFDQIVRIEPGKRYTLSVRLRQPQGRGALSVALCAKALLYSFECHWERLQPEAESRNWQTLSLTFETSELARSPWPLHPIKLSLGNAGSEQTIEVDDVSLQGEDGVERIANGGFSQGSARWLLISDQHQPWHIDQLVVELYFAQGSMGLACFALTLIGTIIILWSAYREGQLIAAGWAGALIGLLVVGSLGSAFDNGRLAMIFYLNVFVATLLLARDGLYHHRVFRPRLEGLVRSAHPTGGELANCKGLDQGMDKKPC